MEVVDKLSFHNPSRGVAVVTVPSLVKEDIRVMVVWLAQSFEGRMELLILEQVLQMRVLDQLVDDTLRESKSQ